MFNWQAIFTEAPTYEAFLAQHGTEQQQGRWANVLSRVVLTDAQKALLGGFVRRMPVLCLAGAWCGDCVNQVPILRVIAEAAPSVDLRVLDREADPALRDALMINGGARVPVVVFLSEDYKVCAVSGDRVLAYYRQKATDELGPACPTGIIPPGPALLAAATADWIEEFERVQLMLRLTGRLRQLHAD